MQDTSQAEIATQWDHAMRAGRYEDAWRISDGVLEQRDPATRDRADLPYHHRWVWDGTPVEGRDVLVRCYHGLGDTLQYARFLPALRARAASVTVEVQPELLSLVSRLAPAVPFDLARPRPASACDIEIMELSHALRLAPSDVPVPYFAASSRAAMRDTAALCWRAGGWDPDRSLPLAKLRCALPHRRLISLQRGPAAREADARFLNPGDSSADIGRTVALIAASSMVVTVDSMVAHLAGALGHPTLVLLKRQADWRWGNGTRSAWYPSIRLFRQRHTGIWTEPLAELADYLTPAG